MKRIIIALTLFAFAGVGCMSVPDGLHVHVASDGCTQDGRCPWGGNEPRNWYDAVTREIVVAPGQSLKVWAHEACHAHQHQTVIDESGMEPTPNVEGWIDLREWLDTDEASAYTVLLTAAGPAPWGDHGIVLLEDFAESCARCLVSGIMELKERFPNELTRDKWLREQGIC